MVREGLYGQWHVLQNIYNKLQMSFSYSINNKDKMFILLSLNLLSLLYRIDVLLDHFLVQKPGPRHTGVLGV